MSEEFKQPPVRPSQIVEFYQPRSTQARPMIVIQVHDKHIEGVYWTGRGATTGYALSARHVSDPELKNRPILLDEGTWDYSLDSKEVQRLRRDIDQLKAIVCGAGELPAAESVAEQGHEPGYEEQAARVLALFAEGMDYKLIAKSTGMHHKRVEKILRESAKTVSA